MIYRYLHTFLVCFIAITSMGQKSAFEFTFTAVDSASHVHLDSVKIMNRTQGNKHIIFWPDTTISLELALGDTLLYVGYATFDPVGINDRLQEDEDFRLFKTTRILSLIKVLSRCSFPEMECCKFRFRMCREVSFFGNFSKYFRGFDAGMNLKTSQGWYAGGNGTPQMVQGACPAAQNTVIASAA